MMTNYTTLDTSLGLMTFVERDGALVALDIGARVSLSSTWNDLSDAQPVDTPVLQAAVLQMKEYLAGCRREFDLPLAPVGTEFQKATWNALTRIPFGQTISYATLAARIGHPRAVRAVGNANGKNPIPIIIPCHRVIGADGSLVGFGCGIHIKQQLLDLEKQFGV